MEFAELVESGLKSKGYLADKGLGMTSLMFSCPCCIYSMTTYKYTLTHARKGAPRLPGPAALLPADDRNYFTQQESERDRAH